MGKAFIIIFYKTISISNVLLLTPFCPLDGLARRKILIPSLTILTAEWENKQNEMQVQLKYQTRNLLYHQLDKIQSCFARSGLLLVINWSVIIASIKINTLHLLHCLKKVSTQNFDNQHFETFNSNTITKQKFLKHPDFKLFRVLTVQHGGHKNGKHKKVLLAQVFNNSLQSV